VPDDPFWVVHDVEESLIEVFLFDPVAIENEEEFPQNGLGTLN
jgi:hypothetical protein